MGWVFSALGTEEPGAEPDPLNGAKSIRELYDLASTNYAGKYTVPVCYHMSPFPQFHPNSFLILHSIFPPFLQ